MVLNLEKRLKKQKQISKKSKVTCFFYLFDHYYSSSQCSAQNFPLSIAFFLSSGVTPSQYLSTFLTLEFSDVFSVTLTIGLTTGLPDWVSGSLAFVLDSVFGSLSFFAWFSVWSFIFFAWFSVWSFIFFAWFSVWSFFWFSFWIFAFSFCFVAFLFRLF